MDSPGSEPSSDGPDSSAADPTPADSYPAQTPPGEGESVLRERMDTTTVLDNDDSDSDISMSADTDEEDDQGVDLSANPLNADAHSHEQPTSVSSTEPAGEGSKKRKYSGSSQGTPNGHLGKGETEEFRKRLRPDEASQNHPHSGRLPRDRSFLPAEIWQHIFTFCPPRALGSLLQVNRSFNAYLDSSSKGVPIEPLSGSAAKVLQPDTIWRASRLLFHHGMPGPLLGKTELDMWKLACIPLCQFCNKRQPGFILPGDQWHPGPGQNGVVPLWSFGIRTCGSCLEEHSTKVGGNFAWNSFSGSN